jgi:hypothetical protein
VGVEVIWISCEVNIQEGGGGQQRDGAAVGGAFAQQGVQTGGT